MGQVDVDVGAYIEKKRGVQIEEKGGAAGQLVKVVKVVKVEMPTSLQLPSAVTRID